MTSKIKIGRSNQKGSGNFRSGILNVWIFPIVIGGVLLILAVFLLTRIIKGAFTQYANCDYLIVSQLKMDPFFCDGFDVQVLGATVFTIPGMKGVMDPPLELARSAAAWGVIFLFASASLFLTVIVVNWKTIVGLFTFRKEEWMRFMTGARVWLFLFVVFCSIFYFTVGR